MKNNIFKKLLIALFLFAVFNFSGASCVSQRSQIINDGLHHIREYSFDPSSDIFSRIKPIPEKHLKIIKQWDNRSDYAAYTPTATEMNMFKEYYLQLPQYNQQTMNQTTVAIYFVKNFIGAGMADFVVDDSNKIYTLLFINSAVFSKSISEWLTYRDSSSFKITDPSVRTEINCGSKYTALMYVLIHESAHIVDYVHGINPYIDGYTAVIFGVKNKRTPFIEGVWKDYTKLETNYDMSGVENMQPYALNPVTLSNTEAPLLYRKLALTPLVSLYGARSWTEDFAETVTMYHLTQKLKQPYTVTVINGSAKPEIYKPEENELVKARWGKIKMMYEAN